MPLCGFNDQMLKGLTLFAQGLYKSADKRATEEGTSVEEAMEREIHEMNVFLAALDEHYEVLRKAMDVDDAMRGLVAWVDRKIEEDKAAIHPT